MNFSTRCLAFTMLMLMVWANAVAVWMIVCGSPWFGCGMLTMTVPLLAGFICELRKMYKA